MQDIVHWLLSTYGQEQMRPGLDRIKRALAPILPKFQNTKIVIIAGTNGKGETTLRLSNLLKDHSHFTWTSPHIERITERFRSEKGEIDVDHLQALIDRCHETVLREKYELSFYEFLFYVFCTWAAENPPEYLLLEVGLGGRLDAVNVFDADLVLLPSISRDHQEILGRRYDQILEEKLGTLRPKSTLMSFVHLKYLRDRSRKIASRIGAAMIDMETLVNVPAYEFSLRNYLLATAAFCYLTNRVFRVEDWHQMPAPLEHRGEIFRDANEWMFFGSHNVDGMRKLIQFLQSGNYNFSKPPFDSVIVAFSDRNSADLKAMLKMLQASGLGKIVLTIFPHPKAAKKEVIAGLGTLEGLEFVEDIKSYVQGWNQKRVLVTGSYYFMGHLQSFLRGR